MGVAQRRDVDAQQLELRRQVGAVEGRGAAGEPVRHDAGHVVAGGDQPPDPLVGQGALPDRPDVRDRGPARVVDDDAAALADLEAGGARELVARADPGGEHHEVGVDGLAVRERQARDRPVGPGPVDRGRLVVDPDLDAELLDALSQGRGAAVVELHRHQPRGELHHGHVQAERPQGVGGLQTQQATADHDAAAGPGGCRPDRVDVVQRAVDEAAGPVVALDRGHERVRAGGQHQLVVGHRRAVLTGERARARVELGDAGAQPVRDGRVVGDLRLDEVEVVRGGPLRVAGQVDAVVRVVHLLPHEHDLGVGADDVTADELGHHAVADHATPHDDDAAEGAGCRAVHEGLLGRRRSSLEVAPRWRTRVSGRHRPA